MRQLAEEGRTMVIVTHEIQFAGEVSDRVIFMDQGGSSSRGRRSGFSASRAHERTRDFLRQILRALAAPP